MSQINLLFVYLVPLFLLILVFYILPKFWGEKLQFNKLNSGKITQQQYDDYIKMYSQSQKIMPLIIVIYLIIIVYVVFF
jgi:ABC-type sugar transport system permease subunit